MKTDFNYVEINPDEYQNFTNMAVIYNYQQYLPWTCLDCIE